MVFAALGLGVATGCEEPLPRLPRPSGAAQGPALFETCAQCHGSNGGGMEEFSAPAIAGLPLWYVQYQLQKFRDGARGAHADDRNGLRMRAMARTLLHEGDLEAVAQYVSDLPVVPPAQTLEGNPEHGQELFAPCVECHGANGAGNPDRHAPPLTALNDWYIVSSLRLFKDGIRGGSSVDEWGLTMRPMAVGIADDAARADVAAYIRTLRGGAGEGETATARASAPANQENGG